MDLEIPGWMAPQDLDVIARIAADVPDDGIIVEVGSWMGQSTHAWATNQRARIYAVDLWKWMPKEYAGVAQDKVDLRGDPYAQFLRNTADLRNVVPLRRNSSGGDWPYGEIDVAFIDAMHQNPWVGEDIRYWEQFVRPGGVICGDDYSKKFPAVIQEAKACAARLDSKLELPGKKFWVVRKPG